MELNTEISRELTKKTENFQKKSKKEESEKQIINLAKLPSVCLQNHNSLHEIFFFSEVKEQLPVSGMYIRGEMGERSNSKISEHVKLAMVWEIIRFVVTYNCKACQTNDK